MTAEIWSIAVGIDGISLCAIEAASVAVASSMRHYMRSDGAICRLSIVATWRVSWPMGCRPSSRAMNAKSWRWHSSRPIAKLAY